MVNLKTVINYFIVCIQDKLRYPTLLFCVLARKLQVSLFLSVGMEKQKEQVKKYRTEGASQALISRNIELNETLVKYNFGRFIKLKVVKKFEIL